MITKEIYEREDVKKAMARINKRDDVRLGLYVGENGVSLFVNDADDPIQGATLIYTRDDGKLIE